MKTLITVRKADGSTKIVERNGHIVEVADRERIAASAAKLGAEIIGWELVSPAPVAPKTPVIVSGRARRRFEQYNSRRRRCNECEGPCDGSCSPLGIR